MISLCFKFKVMLCICVYYVIMATHNLNMLNVITYNCNSLNDIRLDYLNRLLNNCKPTIVFLQETWLLESNLHRLGSVHDDYAYHGISSVNIRDDVLYGRPYGGVAILWNTKIISKHVKDFKLPVNNSKRVCAVITTLSNNAKCLFCSVYMPTDTRNVTHTTDEFESVLTDISFCIEQSNSEYIVLGGDWNCNIANNTAQAKRLRDFMVSYNLMYTFDHSLALKEDTFYSQCNTGTSCIDYYLVSNNVYHELKSCKVNWKEVNTSPHQPVEMSYIVNVISDSNLPNYSEKPAKRGVTRRTGVAWHRAGNDHLKHYRNSLDLLLGNIQLPNAVYLDKAPNANIAYEINHYCHSIIMACINAANETLPVTRKRCTKPFWKELAEPLRIDSLFWHSIWVQCGRPPTGQVAMIRRSTRTKYHRMVKQLQRNERKNIFTRMAEALVTNKSRDLWKEVQCVKRNKNCVPHVIDSVSGKSNIAELFASKYNNLFNSSCNDKMKLDDIELLIKDESEKEQFLPFTIADINKAVAFIKSNKSDGNLGLNSNHIKHSGDSLRVHLTLLINMCFHHGIMPYDLLISTIISIPKDLRKSLCNSDNYRGISLVSSITKMFDVLILLRHGESLNTSELQYSYKAGHSTTHCTWCLKEIINYYINQGSTVYCCLLDASKAFDKIDLAFMFQILKNRGIPSHILRLLIMSYKEQLIRTRFDNELSDYFKATNGVRQGGVISPILFTLYVDEMINKLKSSGIGCTIGNHYAGCLMYADDVTLICPSVTGLQEMVDICLNFGMKNSIMFNDKKTVCIHFSSVQHTGVKCIMVNGKQIPWSKTVRHLGNILQFNLDDTPDIALKTSEMIFSVNKLCSNFNLANNETKCTLFKAYCTAYYGTETWSLCNVSIEKKLNVQWNKCIRRLLDLPYKTHKYILPIISNIPTVTNQIHLRVANFYKKNSRQQKQFVELYVSYF